jgi:hypothetical protein
MAKKQILGFQPTRRLEQVDDEHPKRVQDCEHRQGSCDDSASRRESQAGWNFRKGQDCKEEALRHVLLEASGKCAVHIEFSDTGLNGTRTLGPDLSATTSNTSEGFRSFLEGVKAERIFLRHAQITKFIDETKSEKKEEIAAIIGYEDILSFRDAIQSTYNALRRDATYLTAKQKTEGAKNRTFQLAGAIIVSEKGLFEKANEILSPFNLSIIISDDQSYDNALEALRGKITQPDRAQKKLHLDQFKKDCEQVTADIGIFLGNWDGFRTKYGELAKDKRAVSQLISNSS